MLVDARWDGHFGIGRFSREVRTRIAASLDSTAWFESQNSALSIGGVLELRRRLARGDHEVFYSPAFTGTLPTRGVAQLLTVFDLIHLDVPAERSPAKHAYYSLVVKPAVLRSGWVATCSSHSQDRLREWLGRSEGDVEIVDVGCGISDEFLTATPTQSEAPNFLMVSNPAPHKNVEVALQAIARSTGATLTWVVSDEDAARTAIQASGGSERIRTESKVSDARLAELYRTSAALLMPSLMEGFGLPPVEAMCCGTPVIYTGSCAPVANQCAGVVGNIAIDAPLRVEEWIDAIATVTVSPRRVKLNDTLRSQLSWDRVASNVVEGLSRYSAR